MRFRLAVCAVLFTVQSNVALASAAEIDRWVAANPSPGWEHIATADTFAAYFRTGSCMAAEGGRRCWFKEEHFPSIEFDGQAFQSVMYLYETDCAQRRVRRLQRMAYPQHMTKGLQVTTTTPTDWEFAAPGTLGEGVVNVSCE